ncbi:hypothetical protein TanjilG_04799 [Lupinus angustifolius]|uniref:Uncharacterized protein n=1 Tax=Lupinus angustifolius TaxID=3871 RepID=A0A4P1QS99_LUPAN|nr:hypothetical protein TanjilG_04799 [Lupinus angustifolius]
MLAIFSQVNMERKSIPTYKEWAKYLKKIRIGIQVVNSVLSCWDSGVAVVVGTDGRRIC